MSTGIYDRAQRAPLAEVDDWFAHVQEQRAVEADDLSRETDLSWDSDLEWQLRDPAQPAFSQAALAVGAGVAVVLLFAGILIGRATKSSSTRIVTVAAASRAQGTAGSAAVGSAASASSPAITGAGASTTGTSAGSGSTSGTSAAAGSTAVTSKPATSTPAISTPATSTPATSTPATATSGTGTSNPSPGASAVPTDSTLRPGTTGVSVTALQNALTALRYTPGSADGDYGPGTAAAVTAFQTAKGLAADGVAGAKTLAAINAALSTG
jgi:hypothetical protein